MALGANCRAHGPEGKRLIALTPSERTVSFARSIFMPDMPPANPIASPPTRSRAIRRGFIVLLVLLILGVGSAIAWNNGLRDQVMPRNFGAVEAGQLYRSGQISARLVEPTLRENGIKTIVCLSASGAKPADVAAEHKAANDLGIDWELFPLRGDGTGSVETYAKAVAAINRAKKEGRPVLVHCVAGAQRTGGVIAAYLLLVEKRSPTEVYAGMKAYGHDPRDNPRLLEYLNSHMSELASRLVQMGVIARVPNPAPVIPGR